MIFIIAILFIHFIADFVCQTHWQASNKSKSLYALSSHVLTYTLVLWLGTSILFPGITAAVTVFAIINGVLHFITDAITSRISSKFFAENDWHNFFVVIGFDQFIHHTTLLYTLKIIIIPLL